MIKHLAGVASRIKVYIKKNWGRLFIIAFLLLLAIAATSLLMGLDALAEEVSVYAYYALVLGVASELIGYMKFNKKYGEEDIGSS